MPDSARHNPSSGNAAGLLPARIGFAGTPEFAAVVLRGLLTAGANVVCVYTQPDRPTGRGRKLQPSTVKTLAQKRGIEVRQPKSLRNDTALAELENSNLDVLIVAAYGLILPQPILDAPRLGCINVHASLLPRWRGAAPIERAIMAGDTQSGVCIMRMEAGLDTGGVYTHLDTAVSDTTTGRELHDTLATLGTTALLEALTNFEPDAFVAQNDALACYANKLETSDAEINWHTTSAEVARHINALNDRLPARTQIKDSNEVLYLLRAEIAEPMAEATPGTLIARSKKTFTIATADGAVNITEVQLRRGKGKPMPASAALNGYSDLFEVGQQFVNKNSPPALQTQTRNE